MVHEGYIHMCTTWKGLILGNEEWEGAQNFVHKPNGFCFPVNEGLLHYSYVYNHYYSGISL